MGIFDVFKTKVTEAADKVGDMFDKDKEEAAPQDAPAPEAADAMDGDAAAHMVSEGAPVALDGEAAPGAGDDGDMADAGGGGGMTGTIKQNMSSGVDKAAGMADSATGGKATDQINSLADKAKDMLK